MKISKQLQQELIVQFHGVFDSINEFHVMPRQIKREVAQDAAQAVLEYLKYWHPETTE
jgi:hypothetical protein